MLLGLLLLLAVQALTTASRSLYPDVSFARVMIIAERGESPVRGMLIAVTRPLEQAVATVPGLMRVRSKTIRGASELALDFRADTAMRDALSLVRARAAAAGLPEGVSLTIEQQTPAVFPVLSFNLLAGPAAAADPVARARVAEWAELDLEPRLARLPDVFMVTVQTGDTREYVLEVDPLALAAADLDLLAVRDALAGANSVAAVGRRSAEGLQYQLLVDGLIEDPAELLEVAVPRDAGPPLRIADLATLGETVAERTMVVTGGGQDGVVVSLFLRDGGKVTQLSQDTAAILAEVAPLVPEGGTIEPVYDQAILVDDSILGVRDAILIGALLSTLVLAVFLGDLRMTLVAGMAIPLSVALTIAMFPLIGESLNLMSLGGLAVAIGLIIDDAIVVVENVGRRLQLAGRGPDAPGLFTCVAVGTGEVFGAIVGSSLTTVVVFLPLVLLEGVVGQFFRSLSVALGASILASMVVSLVYTPLTLLLPGMAPRSGRPPRRWMSWMQERYARLVRGALARPLPVTAALLLALLVGAAALRGLETGFLPEMDEGGFVLDYALPVGSSLDETDTTCRHIEAILRETPEVASLSRRTGAELGFFATEPFTGDMLVGLVPRAERERSVFEVMDGLRERMAREVPQSEVEFIQVIQDTIADLAGNPSPLEVKVMGADYPVLQEVADRVALSLEAIPGVVDVYNHVSFGSPELRWRPDPLALARLGLDADDVAAQVSAQLLGDVATRVQERDRFVDVRVRYPDTWRAARGHGADAPDVFVRPANGGSPVPLASVAGFSRQLSENELERENQNPMVRVTASVSGRDLGSAAAAARQAVLALPHDPTARLEFGGQAESQTRAFDNLVLVFAMGAGLVFLLLVVQFRSLRLPAVMFLALPFGQLGALHALRWSGVALNISSGMGLIMLVGLVVKNGIIMIEYTQELCRGGMDEQAAIVESARVRLRPILMTSIAAIAGLVPLALAWGPGAELQRPLAIAVIGGLVVSTLCTLIVVPLGCGVFARGALAPEDHHGR